MISSAIRSFTFLALPLHSRSFLFLYLMYLTFRGPFAQDITGRTVVTVAPPSSRSFFSHWWGLGWGEKAILMFRCTNNEPSTCRGWNSFFIYVISRLQVVIRRRCLQ